jgi:hypothetical protein
MSTRQYARLLSGRLAAIGLDPSMFSTHSLRRTKASLIHRRPGNIGAVQLFLRPHQAGKHGPLSRRRGR